MVTHIVMFKFQPDCPPATIEEMRQQLVGLKGKIDLIRGWEVGINTGESSHAFDLVVYSTFDSMADLAAFRKDPQHVEVATFVRQYVETSGTVDYEN